MSALRRLTGSVFALALAVGASGLVSPAARAADAPAARAADAPAWLSYERPREFSIVVEEVHVPMRDGVGMRCTKIAPVGPDRRPVVIANFFAYRALQKVAFSEMAEGLAERGYATLSCSPRGTGGTPGVWAPFQEQESRDNYDLVEWAGTQPWSTGRVGQTGISYGGIATMKALATNPPHLKAAVPVAAYNEVYREMVYPGGARGTTLRWWPGVTWATSTVDQSPVASAQSLPHFAAFEQRAREHPLYDGYWRSLAIDTGAVDASDVPTLAIGGWNDLFPQGTVRNYLGAKDQTALLMLPGAHGEFAPGLPQFQAGLNAMLSWFDTHLMQRQDVPQPAAKVTSWELPRLTGGWTELADFPAATTRVALDPTGAEHGFVVNPYDNGCSCIEHGLYNSTDFPFNDQRLYDRGRARFDQAPVAADAVIAGAPVAHLRAALSAPGGNLVVRLQDVAPDGTSTVVTTGWLNAEHRLGHDVLAGVEPGKAYDFRVELWPTHWRLRAGHFLRVTVSGGDVQHIEPTAPAGSTVTLFTGAGGSSVDVPFQSRRHPENPVASDVSEPPGRWASDATTRLGPKRGGWQEGREGHQH
ncbi:MAG: CocE/NonD family hydrolase [Sporichthyaceae bacterium]